MNSGAAEDSPTRRRKLLKGGDRFLRKDLKPKPTVSEYCISEGSVEMLIHALSIFPYTVAEGCWFAEEPWFAKGC